MKPFYLLGAACGLGAQIHACKDGPDAILKEHTYPSHTIYPTQSSDDTLALITEFNQRLAQETATIMGAGYFPLIVGGDHSVAIGIWNGVFSGMQREPLGLLWIDAHIWTRTL